MFMALNSAGLPGIFLVAIASQVYKHQVFLVTVTVLLITKIMKEDI